MSQKKSQKSGDSVFSTVCETISKDFKEIVYKNCTKTCRGNLIFNLKMVKNVLHQQFERFRKKLKTKYPCCLSSFLFCIKTTLHEMWDFWRLSAQKILENQSC